MDPTAAPAIRSDRGASATRLSGSAWSAVVLVALALGACVSSPMLPTGSIHREEEVGQRPSADFSAFVEHLWPEARARGVSRATFDRAFDGVTPDPKIIALTRKQAEFVRPVGDYIAKAVSPARLERGQAFSTQYSRELAAAERKYGVDRSVIIGVWGMETNYGSNFGNNYVIRALATLAYERYRGDYFRKELLVALQILQEGDVDAEAMRGSWAGAMGHTQFMPTSFVQYAVDEDGDGRRDIWNSVPDAIGSTANYLARHGWQKGLPWGFEVDLPAGGVAGAPPAERETAKRPFASWAAAGVKRADGQPMPREGEAALLRPAGPNGPVFLVTSNFAVIKRYNNSTAYALGVAHLGDRVYGGMPIQASWPTGTTTR